MRISLLDVYLYEYMTEKEIGKHRSEAEVDSCGRARPQTEAGLRGVP